MINVFDVSFLFALCVRRPLLISTASAFSSCWILFWLIRDRPLTTALQQVSKSHSMFGLFSLKVSASNNRTPKNQADNRLVFWQLCPLCWYMKLSFFFHFLSSYRADNWWSNEQYGLMLNRDAESLSSFSSISFGYKRGRWAEKSGFKT